MSKQFRNHIEKNRRNKVKIITHNTQIHDRSLSWIGTGKMMRGTGKMMRCTGEMMCGTGEMMRGIGEMMRSYKSFHKESCL
jgi:hypothetical protein